MILENGVIRTMDPSLPTATCACHRRSALAGGVGTHETALPSPDVVDLGGRCVLPGFTDSHVHFPTWSLSQHEVKLDGVTGLADALDARPHAPAPRLVDPRVRLAFAPNGSEQPTAAALDAVTGRRAGAALLEGLPLGLAQLGGSRLRRRRPGRRRRRRRARRDRGADRGPARGVRVAVPRPLRDAERGRVRGGDSRRACASPASRGVVAIHDKDGWLGAPGIFQRIAERDGLSLRVWQSDPVRAAARARGARHPLRVRRRVPPHRLPEGLHGRNARLADRVDARRLGRDDHERRRARRGHPRGRAVGLAVGRPRDRGQGEPRGARRLRIDARGVGAARPATPDRARAVPRTAGRASLRSARRRVLRPVQPRTVGSRPRRALLARAGRRRLRVPLALGIRRAGRERFRRTGRGARSTRRDPRGRAEDDRRPTGVAPGAVPLDRADAHRDVRQSRLALRRRAPARQAPPRLPRRSRRTHRDPLECPADELESVEVVATMVGGRWMHNPPPWD